jgi:HPr kinase/phosphorylase
MKPKYITPTDILSQKGKPFKLSVAFGKKYLNKAVKVSEINRPGLALDGHLENFRAERIQIIGRGEYAFCAKEDSKKLLKNLKRMLSSRKTPCLIITCNLKPVKVLMQACKAAKIPILTTELNTPSFVSELSGYLDDKLAPVTREHGVLVDVYGLGVLIRGGAGIGKSECALELVKRGHIMVADDIVEIERRRGDILLGSCPNILKHYMEVRGLGIIDIELLFGVGSVMEQTNIEMEVHLVAAGKQYTCDRTGLEQKTTSILGVEIPSICMPVTPGRNLAVLIEVAALNQRLKSEGIFSAREFNGKLLKQIKSSAKKNK